MDVTPGHCRGRALILGVDEMVDSDRSLGGPRVGGKRGVGMLDSAPQICHDVTRRREFISKR